MRYAAHGRFGTERPVFAFLDSDAERLRTGPAPGDGANNSMVSSVAGRRPMGWWIVLSGLIFVVAAILACSSVLPTNELARGVLDVVAILSGMVCVGLGEGV